jgi:hypothetical protein
MKSEHTSVRMMRLGEEIALGDTLRVKIESFKGDKVKLLIVQQLPFPIRACESTKPED